MKNDHIKFMREAIRISRQGMQNNEGGPFGAIVVKDGMIIGRGNNQVLATNDPTAHAEVVAIREACKTLGSFQLEDCILYSSCEPCPMCLGAIYWARPDRLFFACDKKDAAAIGFDDDFIYREIERPIPERKIPTTQILQNEAKAVFREWEEKKDKTMY